MGLGYLQNSGLHLDEEVGLKGGPFDSSQVDHFRLDGQPRLRFPCGRPSPRQEIGVFVFHGNLRGLATGPIESHAYHPTAKNFAFQESVPVGEVESPVAKAVSSRSPDFGNPGLSQPALLRS